ncbi:MAG TPA: TIGR02281 family clan AA aspartic protease [Rhizomicrobium sp.]
MRFYTWIAVLVGGGLALWQLSRLFPNSGDRAGWDETYLVRNVAILALVSGAIVSSRAFKARELVRNAAIWTAIAAVLVIGYTYQDELKAMGTRVRSELVPSYAVESEAKTVVLTQSDGGDYRVTGSVNGTAVTFMIDTGASDIVLSPADAQRLGIDLSSLRYDKFYETANGGGQGASLTVDNLTVGGISFDNVQVSVNRAPMSSSLLGMAFLRRLKSFEFSGRRLTLRAN